VSVTTTSARNSCASKALRHGTIVSMVAQDKRMLDLSGWDSVEAALNDVETRNREFEEALYPFLERNASDANGALTLYSMFVMSAVTRACGLHGTVVREIRQSNPHGVFPAMRSLLETMALCFYVADNPAYVDALASHPREHAAGTPRRKSPQALIDYMDRSGRTGQLADVYRELCEITHFGNVAMWAAWQPSEGEGAHVEWSTKPRFRDKTDLVACGQLDELTTMMTAAIRELGQTLLLHHGIIDSPAT
jgi:hypothetical protein